MSKKYFLVSVVQYVALDNDLMRTRSADNEVKMISDRKVDREGHCRDSAADPLLMFTLQSRFRGCGEPQLPNYCHLLNSLRVSC